MFKKNSIIQGDFTEVLKTFPSESVDVIVTDPPYFVRYRDRSGRTITNDTGPAEFLPAFPGRRYPGIELDSAYCDHARKRLAGVSRHIAARKGRGESATRAYDDAKEVFC